MTNRFFAIDVRDKIITLLQDNVLGFNVIIGTINTERTHTTPTAKSISYEWGQNQTQLIRVDVIESEVLYNEACLDLSLTKLPENFKVAVSGFLKSNDTSLKNWVEDWIEAIIRVLHNYNNYDITWIAYTDTKRTDLYNEKNETAKMFDVNFEVRIK